MKLSIVTTLYNSSSHINEFYSRIVSEAKKITENYELVVVDDGSFDDSLQKVVTLQITDAKLIVIELSRNHGHHKAMMIGLSHCSGDYILMIDCDLEEEPELLSQYWKSLKKNPENDVIYGLIKKRNTGFLKRIAGRFFYRALNLLSGEDMPVDISFSRLMTKRYVMILREFREREMYIGGLWHIAGFNQKAVQIDKGYKGDSTYTLSKKIAMVANAVTSFSNRPLLFIFYLGIMISLFSFAAGLIIAGRTLFFYQPLSGWTSLIVTIFFVSGIIIFCMGIIAVYLSKIFIETKRRPYSTIKHIYRKNQN